MSEGAPTRLITRFLKIPPEPEAPMGSGSVQVFNASPGYYRYRVMLWILKQLGTLIGLVVGLAIFADGVELSSLPINKELARLLEFAGVMLFGVQIPFTYLMVRLDYRYRWYMITDTSLRIREGLLILRERTMTYANIQNLSLRQGPVQRFFGISDLKVQTAGGGGAQPSGESTKELSEAANMHLGFFRGIDNAEEIRDLILDRMRGLRDTGLGDPDEPVSQMAVGAAPRHSCELLSAAQELLTEAAKLRAVVER